MGRDQQKDNAVSSMYHWATGAPTAAQEYARWVTLYKLAERSMRRIEAETESEMAPVQ